MNFSVLLATERHWAKVIAVCHKEMTRRPRESGIKYEWKRHESQWTDHHYADYERPRLRAGVSVAFGCVYGDYQSLMGQRDRNNGVRYDYILTHSGILSILSHRLPTSLLLS